METPETPQVAAHEPVIVNSDGLLIPNPLNPRAPEAVGATLVDENPFKQNLYSDKKCSASWFCRNTVHWRVVSGKITDPYANEDASLPRGVHTLGPAVMDSLQAQLEYAEGSAKNRPMGALVEDDAKYYCEKHYREQEKRRAEVESAAAAELELKRNAANPYLWSLDPTGVQVELRVDDNFLLTFPDGFEMTWEGFRVNELNQWRTYGRKAV